MAKIISVIIWATSSIGYLYSLFKSHAKIRNDGDMTYILQPRSDSYLDCKDNINQTVTAAALFTLLGLL